MKSLCKEESIIPLVIQVEDFHAACGKTGGRKMGRFPLRGAGPFFTMQNKVSAFKISSPA